MAGTLTQVGTRKTQVNGQFQAFAALPPPTRPRYTFNWKMGVHQRDKSLDDFGVQQKLKGCLAVHIPHEIM